MESVNLSFMLKFTYEVIKELKISVFNIYIYIHANLIDCRIFEAEIAGARKRFWHPLLTSKPATLTQSAQTTLLPYQP